MRDTAPTTYQTAEGRDALHTPPWTSEDGKTQRRTAGYYSSSRFIYVIEGRRRSLTVSWIVSRLRSLLQRLDDALSVWDWSDPSDYDSWKDWREISDPLDSPTWRELMRGE